MNNPRRHLSPPEPRPEIWSGAAVEDVEEQRAARLPQRAVKALGYSATNELQGPERYLVARLLRRNTKVPIGWLTEQFGLQTGGGMRYGLYHVGGQLASNKTLQRTWRTLNSL